MTIAVAQASGQLRFTDLPDPVEQGGQRDAVLPGELALCPRPLLRNCSTSAMPSSAFLLVRIGDFSVSIPGLSAGSGGYLKDVAALTDSRMRIPLRSGGLRNDRR